jgi:hypothetical protein
LGQIEGVNLQVRTLDPHRGTYRLRVDAGYYQFSLDEWGRGQFQKETLEEITPDLLELQNVTWADFTELHSLQSARIESLKDLETLEFDNCRKLHTLKLADLPNLKDLRISGCYELRTLTGLGTLKSLQRLSLTPNWEGKFEGQNQHEIIGLKELNESEHLRNNLKWLGWRDVVSLEELPPDLPNLEGLDIGLHPSGIKSQRIKSVSALPQGDGTVAVTRTVRTIPDFTPLKRYPKLHTLFVFGLEQEEIDRLLVFLKDWKGYANPDQPLTDVRELKRPKDNHRVEVKLKSQLHIDFTLNFTERTSSRPEVGVSVDPPGSRPQHSP